MKQLKLFFALFAMLALGVGNAWGQTKIDVVSAIGFAGVTTNGYTAAGTDYSAVANTTNNTSVTYAMQVFDGKTGAVRGNKSGNANFSCRNTTTCDGYYISKVVLTVTGGTLDGATNNRSVVYFGTSAYANPTTAPTGTSTKSAENATGTTLTWNNTNEEASYFILYNLKTSGTLKGGQITITWTKKSGGDDSGSTTPIALTAPTNLQATNITETSATLSWDAVANASNYSVTINGNTETITTTSYSATGLTAGTAYTWSVVAKGDVTNYTDSDAAQHTFTTTAATTPDPEEPGTGSEALSYTWDLSKKTYSAASEDQVTWSSTDVSMVVDKANSTTNANNYLPTTRTSSRFYQNSILTITPEANVTITSVVFTATSDSYATALKNSAWTNATATASSKTVTVTPTNGASAISATIGATCGFTGVTVHYTKAASGEPENPTPSVSVAPVSHTFATTNVGETATQEFTITAKNTEATLSASIDNTTDFAIAITGDKVTVTYQPKSAGDHTATMTVKAGEEASTTVALTGKAVAALEGTWILVTDASSLKAGDEIIIASKDENYALSIAQNTNNRGQVEVTKTDNTITATSEAQVLTLQAGTKEGTLALYTGAGYLYAASTSSNWLRTETNLSDNSSWTIAVAADGTATLIAQGTNTKNTLYYNKSSKIFSCYSTAQQSIVLYKNTNGQQLAGLAYTTTKYLTKLGDAFATPALTNPNSLTVTYSSSDDNVATVAADGAVTIKAAGVVKITASFAGNSSFLEGSASYTIGVTEHAGTQADPYSVADARRVIDVMETAEGVYATGIVSEIVNAYNEQYGNITYNISIDGSTAADQLQAYRGKGVNGENFSSANDIKVGDEVVIKGNLKLHNGTLYEFDANNQLVSLKREKQQAGLAYEEKEHTANVGEDFTEPTLTNPNSLTVTYSSSNTALATVDATTGEVSILAAGKVTITASSAADATYAAGSASYNITITDPSLAIATLPFYFDGKRADIEGTAGMTQSKIGTDYADAPYLKFNTEGAWAIVQFDSEPGEFSFLLKQNGESIGTFTVYESENGEDYTPIWSGGDLGGNAKSATIEPTLSATARYVKFEYTTKPTGTNYGLGEISIKKADNRAEAGLAWNPATVSLTVGDAFTAPTLSNPNGLTLTCTSDNENLATVTNAGVVTLKSGVTGKATITAKFDGNGDYKDATVTCTITVNPKTENVVILAEYNGQWYALKAETGSSTNSLAALEVEYFNGILYNVDEADKASITWKRTIVGNFETFQYGDKYLKGSSSTNLFMEDGTEGKYQWDKDTHTMLIGSTNRTFLYQGTYFKNYAISNAGRTVDGTTYSALPVVTAAKFETATFYTRPELPVGNYGTICLPYAVNNFTGATFYKVAGKEDNKIVFDEVTELEAGKPYIFMAEATEIKLAQVGEEYTGSAQLYNSLQGTFTQIDPAVDNILVGNYMLVNNIIKKCGINCGLKANRAYFVATELEGLEAPQSQMPGRRRISLNVTSENTTTGLDNITNGEDTTIKVIENGQLIIIRDGEKFNAQGIKL